MTQKMQFRPLMTQKILINQAIAEVSVVMVFWLVFFLVLVGPQDTKILVFYK